jgi:hypothetical protein
MPENLQVSLVVEVLRLTEPRSCSVALRATNSAVAGRRYKFSPLHSACFRRTNSANSVTLNMPASCAAV